MRGRDVQEDMVKIISDKDGKQLVLINDIKFKTRRTIDWKMVESYLKEYIGNHYEILETSEKYMWVRIFQMSFVTQMIR